jgi:tetratricopeptide (TPR) repeat protein
MTAADGAALLDLAKALARSGDRLGAAAVIDLSPRDPAIANSSWATELYLRRGDLLTLTRMARAGFESVCRLTELLIRRNSLQVARRYLEQASSILHWGPAERLETPSRLPLAIALFRLGRDDEAMTFFEQILATKDREDASWAVRELRRRRLQADKRIESRYTAYIDQAEATWERLEPSLAPRLTEADSLIAKENWLAAFDVLEDVLLHAEIAGRHKLEQLYRLDPSIHAWQLRQRVSNPENTFSAAIYPDWVQWVFLAISSGVLGNAAYQGLVEAAHRAWQRVRPEERKEESGRLAEQRPPTKSPPTLRSEPEAFALACIAMHDHCMGIGADPPNLETIGYEAIHTSDGRWVMTFRERSGRRFMVSLPPAATEAHDLTVALFLSRRHGG